MEAHVEAEELVLKDKLLLNVQLIDVLKEIETEHVAVKLEKKVDKLQVAQAHACSYDGARPPVAP